MPIAVEPPASACLLRRPCCGATPFRTVRPSLLDLRFTGDPWVVGGDDGAACLCLDTYQLATVAALRLDLPSLNRTWSRLRRPVGQR
ncbi:MAG TPA: hypothetical protein VMS17_32910 [Gemmataceae bacterium]|nr:hypothetical protein [Gemmataceae bacterium]